MTMRIADVKFRPESGEVSLLVEYGWGGGYAQASRFWSCADIADATRGDISEVHEAWSKMDTYVARQVRHLSDGGTLRVSEMQAAFEPDSAQEFLRSVAALLGVDRDNVSLARLGKTMDLATATERLVAAAKKSLHVAMTA